MDHSVAAVDVVWGVEIATFSMNWRGPNLMVVGNNIEQAFKHFWEGIDIVREKLSEYPQIWDRYQKWWSLKCISFQIWLFWVSMLVFGWSLPLALRAFFSLLDLLNGLRKKYKMLPMRSCLFSHGPINPKMQHKHNHALIFSSINICVFFVSPLSTSGCVFAPHSTSSDSFFGNQSADPGWYTPRLDNLPSNVASCTWQGTGLWMAFVHESWCFRNPMRDSHAAILVYVPTFEPWISTK